MTKKSSVLAASAVAAAIAIWLTFFHATPEDQIKKVLARFTRAVMVKEGDNVISRTARLKSELHDTVDEDVRVAVPEMGVDVRGRRQLVEDATKVGLVYQTADCELVDVKIQVEEGSSTAKADATALVTGVRGGERRVDKRPVHFLLHKEGDWRITTIDVLAPSAD